MQNKVETKFKETDIGLILEEWNVVSVGEISELVSRGITPSYSDEGVLILNQKCIRNGVVGFNDSRFTDSIIKKIPEQKYLKSYDILINSTGQGTLGRVAQIKIVDKLMTVDSHVTIVRADEEKINPQFLGCYLKSIQHVIEAMAEGSTGQTELAREKVSGIQVPVPSKEEQKQIAEILSSLDDKIELSRQINTNLEKIASALFKRWFVDFEFPDENGKPYKSSGGKMVESELGEIPEGWKVGKLSDIANITIGRTPPRLQEQWFSENPEDIKWISIRDLGNSGIYVDKTAEYLTRAAVEKFSIPVIPKNTVVLSFKLTVGRLAITSEEMLSNEAIAHIKLSDKNISTEYIYLALQKFDYSSLGSTSSIATAVNSKSIKDIPLLIPEEKTIKKFTNVVELLFQEILENSKQLNLLIQTRDSLLPRLMNGKIRVKSE